MNSAARRNRLGLFHLLIPHSNREVNEAWKPSVSARVMLGNKDVYHLKLNRRTLFTINMRTGSINRSIPDKILNLFTNRVLI